MAIKACFADSAVLPIACSHDIDELHNCIHANNGVAKLNCKYYQPAKAIKLALDILGATDEMEVHE